MRHFIAAAPPTTIAPMARRMPLPGLLLPAALMLTLALAAGCEDLRRFSGDWVGTVSPDPALQLGFGPGAALRARVLSAGRHEIQLTVDLPGTGPLPFAPIRHASNDTLGDLRLDGEPLRSYLGYLEPTGAPPFLTVVSLFPDDRIDVRIIRGPAEVYGVFSLRRAR